MGTIIEDKGEAMGDSGATGVRSRKVAGAAEYAAGGIEVAAADKPETGERSGAIMFTGGALDAEPLERAGTEYPGTAIAARS